MKKQLLIFIFCFCIAAVGLGQSNVYHPMPDSNAVWTQTFQSYWGESCPVQGSNGPLLHDYSFSYTLKGDTLINGNTYHKIYKTGTEDKHCTGGYNYHVWSTYLNLYVGAYRQNVALKKIFFVGPYSTQETVKYDFTAIVGTTLVNSCSVTVTSIDSILIGTNYRKRFNLSSIYKIIEGIGSTSGLIESICPPFESFGFLTCFKQNNKNLYPDTINQCQVMTGVNTVKKSLTFAIAPNPSSGIYNVTGLQNECELEVFDINGRSVYKKTVTEHSAIIDLTLYNKGIYYYRVVDSYGNSGHGTLALE